MSSFFKLVATGLILAGTLKSLAQSGPAGIGTPAGNGEQPKVSVWLSADDLSLSNGSDVLSWIDRSNGNAFNAVSATSPVYALTGPNSRPFVSFSKSDNRIVLTPFDGMPERELSVLIVYRTTDSGDGLLSYAVTGRDNEFLIFDNSAVRTYIDNSNNNSGVAFNSGNWQVYSLRWQSSDGSLELFKDNSLVHTATHKTGVTISTGGAMAIGNEQDAVNSGYQASQAFSGGIAEIIIYDHYLTEPQRVILNNYLSSKFDITISNDFYAGDTPGNGDFDLDVIGIGQSSGQQHTSASSGGLTISDDGSSLDTDGEFVLAGHNSPTNGVTAAGVPAGVEERWIRSWYIDKTGVLGAEISFNLQEGIGGLYPADNGDYTLLRYNGASWDEVAVAGVVSGEEINFTADNITLTDGIYTLGTRDASASPLTGVTNNIWYSYQSGDWTDPDTWTLDGSVTPIFNNPGGEIPSPIDDVVITNGRTVTMDVNSLSASGLDVIGTLDVAATEGHSFNVITGNGRIRLSGSVSGLDNFPDGDASDFGSETGGTIELYGTGLTLDEPRTFNNVEINLTATGNEAILMADYQMNGELSVNNGTLRFNDNISTNSISMEVQESVVIQSGGRISTGTATARHQFTLEGDLINNGGIISFSNRSAPNYNSEATDGIVDVNFVNSSANQQIICNGICEFYRIEIDKGVDETYMLDISANSSSNFALFGPANQAHGSTTQLTTNNNALGLLRGTVRLGENISVPVINNSGNYNISEGARIWVDGGSLSKTAGSAIVIYGTIRLSGGTINSLVQNGLTTRQNGNIIISDGVLTTRQIRTSIEGIDNVGGYTQSGGEVYITGGSYNTDYYAFSLTFPGNTFTMSGGQLTVNSVSGSGPSGRQGGIFINVREGNYNVTGGTVIMENTTNQNFKVTSTAPFWNVVMRESGGSSAEVELDAGISGDNNPGEFQTISNPELRVLNDLTVEDGVIFDHNGFDVEIGGNFVVEENGDYLYDAAKMNTTTINGSANSIMAFYNRTGGGSDLQRFHNLVINKPTNKTVTLVSGKTGGMLNQGRNRLIGVYGDAFKLLSGTLDQKAHALYLASDTVINYDVFTIYDVNNATPASTANGNNDIIEFGSQDFALITADSAVFGAVRISTGGNIVQLRSDIYVQYFEYQDGRIHLQDNNLKVNYFADNLNSAANFDFNGNGSIEGSEEQVYSPADMLVTSGNSSDGGLSIYVDADGTFFYPFGVGTDATNLDRNTSRYTPATVTITGVTDDGYITIRPVDQVLGTTDGTGGDILSYYWRVDYEGFSSLPTVEYLFNYYDEDLDGSVNESLFVAGKVLEDNPFTRNYEDDGVPENEGVDDSANEIVFNGNGDAGFTLESASYTAGESGRFIGQPEVFYNRNNGRKNWTDNTKWTTNADGSDDGETTIPGSGDVVILRSYGQGNQNAWVNLNTDISIARLTFDRSAGGWATRLTTTKRDAVASLGVVSGYGAIYVEHTISEQPDFTGSDLGLFASEPGSFFIFRADADNTTPVPLPTTITTFPNLRIEGGNGAFNQRITQNTTSITINGDMWIDWGGTFSAAADMHIKGDLLVGRGGGARGLFELYDAAAVVIDIDGDLVLWDNTSDPRLTVRNSALNSLQHEIRVAGDVLIERGILDLFNGNGTDNNAQLVFDGAGDASFSRTGGSLPDLYRIKIAKSGNRNDVVDLLTDFDLGGATGTMDKPVTFVSGILRFNQPDLDITLSSLGDVQIPSVAGLQVSQGTVRVYGDDSGIILDGSIEIDGGTLDMTGAGNGNNFIEYSSGGSSMLTISAGSLIVGSQIRPITSAETGILKYRQTGGDVFIGVEAAPESDRGMLQIYNQDSEFTFTGGTITISRHQDSPTIAALYLDPETASVTSTITLFDSNTPSGQSGFGINSSVPLGSLIIQGDNNPSANIQVNPLTLEGDLQIDANATLDANGFTLTLENDFLNNGIYLPDGNETIFNSDADQTFSGTGTGDFTRLTKQGTGQLDLMKEITVSGLFSLLEGAVDDNGNSMYMGGNVLLDGTHFSSGVSGGFTFGGLSQQLLYRSAAGTGSFGIVTIDNPSGVVIPDGNGYDFVINGDLRLSAGVLNIGGSLLTIGQLSEIIPVNPFSTTNMIQTNSSFTDNGVLKYFPSGYSQDFIFPVGELLYTPISFNFGSGSNSFGSSQGSIKVRPSAEYHPVVNDGTDYFATGDINNVLQYYWIVEASGVTGLTAEMTFAYDQTHVKTDEPGYSELDYLSARILSNSNPTNAINKFTTAEVDESANIINFQLTGVASDGISGDYFAGIDEAIPDNVLVYTSLVDGNVDQAIYDNTVPGGGPPNGAILRVANGTTVTFSLNGVSLYRTEIEAGGVLEIDETSQHRLGIVSGSGTLRIVSNSSNANFPAGYYNDFLSCASGSLEFAGTGSYTIMSGITSVRALKVTGSGTRTLANNNVRICEDLEIDGPFVAGKLQRQIQVDNEFLLTSGTFNAPSGSGGRVIIGNNLWISGGNFTGAASSGFTRVDGDVLIDGGNLNIGGQTYEFQIAGNLTRTSGSFDGGDNQARVIFNGAGDQQIAGDFTGANSFYRMELNSGGDVSLLNNVTITDGLYLENGFILPGANQLLLTEDAMISPATGRSNSFVSGKLYKEISNGDDFIFPVGKNGRLRYASVNNVTSGTRTWDAEYFPLSPENHPDVDNLNALDPAILTISTGEYWVISDGSVTPTGTNAEIGLNWGTESDVSASKPDREKLVVVNWNATLSGWDNLGGTNFSAGHSQSNGYLESQVQASFSEQIFTLGTSDLANPLPITLDYFRGRVDGTTNVLEWRTLTEMNNEYFEIQHSTDGEHFETITKIDGAGFSTSPEFYFYTHTNPPAGINYYRLTQVDYDGTSTYFSKTVRLENKYAGVSEEFTLYPNPTDVENIYLTLETNRPAQIAEIKIIDLYGHVISSELTEIIPGRNTWHLQPRIKLKTGVYIITLQAGFDKLVKRLVIN